MSSNFYALSTIKNRYATELGSCEFGMSAAALMEKIAGFCADPQMFAKKDDVPLFNANRAVIRPEGCIHPDRRAESFDIQTALIVDFDSGVKMIDASAHLNSGLGVDFLIYASFNNGKEGVEKFRAVIPLNWALNMKFLECPAVREKLASYFPGCDTSTFDRGRFFNMPARRRSNENTYTWMDGRSPNCIHPFNINALCLGYIYEQWLAEKQLRYVPLTESAPPANPEAFATRKLSQFGYRAGCHDTPLYKTACAMRARGFTETDASKALCAYATEGHSPDAIAAMVKRVFA